jgi:hypothetical protein
MQANIFQAVCKTETHGDAASAHRDAQSDQLGASNGVIGNALGCLANRGDKRTTWIRIRNGPRLDQDHNSHALRSTTK